MYNVKDGERVYNYVVSSYTPTLNALLTSLPPVTDSFKMMAVIQPHTPGFAPLSYTLDELAKIKEHVPQRSLVQLGIPGAPATVTAVLSQLSTASIVHLACHGVQGVKSPLESALILDDGKMLKVSQIMEQHMPNASLAFLGACGTAMSDENLPDETIHLAASLLFIGFHGTVATMWWVTFICTLTTIIELPVGQFWIKMDQRLLIDFMHTFSKPMNQP
jgi:CHAT domain-containing protein